MKDHIKDFDSLLLEGKTDPFQEFAQKRHDGARDIVDRAKKKGGTAMLTYHHFVVKLPYYREAVAGRFDQRAAKSELKRLNLELASLLKTFEPKDQIPFQKTMGRIEVLGELIIRSTQNE